MRRCVVLVHLLEILTDTSIVNRPQTIYYIMIAHFVEEFRIVSSFKYVLSTFTPHIIFVVFFMEFLLIPTKLQA
jgi:hypothetical protein